MAGALGRATGSRHDDPMDAIRVTASSGRIEVIAEPRGDVVVDRGQEHPMGGVLEVCMTTDLNRLWFTPG